MWSSRLPALTPGRRSARRYCPISVAYGVTFGAVRRQYPRIVGAAVPPGGRRPLITDDSTRGRTSRERGPWRRRQRRRRRRLARNRRRAQSSENVEKVVRWHFESVV